MIRLFILFVLSTYYVYASCSQYITKVNGGVTCRGYLCAGMSVSCPTVPNSVLLYTDASECRLSNIPSCGVVDNYDIRCYYYTCQTQCDLDSLNCVRDGGRWEYDVNSPTCGGMYCNTSSCDSTFNCTTYPLFRCLDVPASSQITCINGNCSGLPYSMWWSEARQECTNECGQYKTTVIQGDTAVTFGVACGEEQEKCSSKKYCTEIGGNYIVYKKCLIGREVIGNVDTRQEIPYIVQSGVGTCSENGYDSEKYTKTSGGQFSGGGGAPPLSDDCLLYGVGCPETYKDTLDYTKEENRNPTSCYCKPFDGLNSLSQIVCPDGSSTVVYMSCKEWENSLSSSSGAGGVSSSTPSPNTSTSTNNSSDSFGQYPRYPTDQSTTNSNVQGALSGISEYLIQIKDNLLSLKNYFFSDDEYIFVDSVPTYGHGEYVEDTIKTVSFDSLLNVIDTNRHIIDTSKKVVSNSVCPIISANFSCTRFLPFVNNDDVNLRIDLDNLYGFSLCKVFKALVLAFSSIVSFFIGFSIFGKRGL